MVVDSTAAVAGVVPGRTAEEGATALAVGLLEGEVPRRRVAD